MNALEEKEKPTLARRNNELTVNKPSRQLFKVVVNNYRQDKRRSPIDTNEGFDESITGKEQGLPPQPTSYIKYPTYDWF